MKTGEERISITASCPLLPRFNSFKCNCHVLATQIRNANINSFIADALWPAISSLRSLPLHVAARWIGLTVQAKKNKHQERWRGRENESNRISQERLCSVFTYRRPFICSATLAMKIFVTKKMRVISLSFHCRIIFIIVESSATGL